MFVDSCLIEEISKFVGSLTGVEVTQARRDLSVWMQGFMACRKAYKAQEEQDGLLVDLNSMEATDEQD